MDVGDPVVDLAGGGDVDDVGADRAPAPPLPYLVAGVGEGPFDRSASATVAPSAANGSAMASPSPWAAPVTATTRPS